MKLILKQSPMKTEKQKQKCPNPAQVYAKNHVSSKGIEITPDQLAGLQAGDPSMVEMVRRRAHALGLGGRIQVSYAAGGLGPQGLFESKEEWRSSRPVSGFPKIMELEV